MRVTLVGMYYAPVIGGIETHMKVLAGGLAREGIPVTVSCLARLLVGGSTRKGIEVVAGVPVRRVGSYGVGQSLRWPETLVPEGSADIVHFHGFSRPLLLRFLTEKSGRPWVITPHGGLHMTFTDPQPLRRFAKLTFDRMLAGILLRTASKVIALTDVEASHLERVGVNSSRISIFPNVVADESLELSALPQGGSGRFLVLSRLAPRKRVNDVLEAFLRFPDPPGCDIAGPDEGEMRRLKELAGRMPGQAIRFLGPVDGRAKLDLLRSAKALILASSLEGLAIAPLEALAQGTPVIASDAAAVGLPRRGVVTFPVGDIAALADRIRSLEDRSLLDTLRMGALAARAEIKTQDDQLQHALGLYKEAQRCA